MLSEEEIKNFLEKQKMLFWKCKKEMEKQKQEKKGKNKNGNDGK